MPTLEKQTAVFMIHIRNEKYAANGSSLANTTFMISTTLTFIDEKVKAA